MIVFLFFLCGADFQKSVCGAKSAAPGIRQLSSVLFAGGFRTVCTPRVSQGPKVAKAQFQAEVA
jgi:hypothetical protein